MVIRVKTRRETPRDWAEINPVLADGEIGVEKEDSDTIRFKIGNGTDRWTRLPYCDVATSGGGGGDINFIDGGRA